MYQRFKQYMSPSLGSNIYTYIYIYKPNKYVSKDQFNFKSIPEHK